MNNIIIFEFVLKNNSHIFEVFNKDIFKSVEDAILYEKDISVLPIQQINLHCFNITNNINLNNYDELDTALYKETYNYLCNNKRYHIKNLKKLLNIELEYNSTYIHYLTSIF